MHVRFRIVRISSAGVAKYRPLPWSLDADVNETNLQKAYRSEPCISPLFRHRIYAPGFEYFQAFFCWDIRRRQGVSYFFPTLRFRFRVPVATAQPGFPVPVALCICRFAVLPRARHRSFQRATRRFPRFLPHVNPVAPAST